MFWNKDKELIEYAEQEAKINARFQIDCADSLQKSSGALFSILLSGAGGGLALAVSLFEDDVDVWLWLPVAVVSVYLFGISALIVKYCLQAQDLYPPANEPGNIFNDKNLEMGLLMVRREELASRQRVIDKNIIRNGNVAYWFNLASTLSTLTPLVFILASCFSYLLV